ncbi:MAG TPA: DUF3800 domain-containing protein [bacterium]|nr:DUF3800 domain-containing protein [bacterium]
MHLLYIDESGDVGRPRPNATNFFVAAGFSIDEVDCRKLRFYLHSIKQKYSIPLITELKWEYFHKPFINPSLSDKHAKRAALNPLNNWDPARKHDLLCELLDALRGIRSVRFYVVSINKQAAYEKEYINKPESMYSQALLLLLERFQNFLRKTQNRGIGIQDSRDKSQDRRLRSFYHSLFIDGSYYTKFENIVDNVYLTPSEYSFGVQFADLVAGIAFQKFERGNDTYFSAIIDKIDCTPLTRVRRGTPEGLKLWP